MKVATISGAREFAEKAHKGQKRSFSDEPYVNHPYSVAKILYDMGASTDLVIAAILHDTLEDTPVTMFELEAEFGAMITSLVWWVSEPSKIEESKHRKPTKHQRKAEFNSKISAAPTKAQTLKAADILHNTLDMIKYGHMNTGRAERFAIAKRTTTHLLKGANKELLKKVFKALDELDAKVIEWTSTS